MNFCRCVSKSTCLHHFLRLRRRFFKILCRPRPWVTQLLLLVPLLRRLRVLHRSLSQRSRLLFRYLAPLDLQSVETSLHRNLLRFLTGKGRHIAAFFRILYLRSNNLWKTFGQRQIPVNSSTWIFL